MNKTSTGTSDLSEQIIRAQAAKLAYLLTNIKMPVEQKDAWEALLPDMSLDQLQRLVNILENLYLQQQTKDIDADFSKDLEKIKADYLAGITGQVSAAEAKIKDLSNQS